MKKITSFLRILPVAIFVCTLGAYLLGRLGYYHWFADLFSHWQGQYLVVFFVLFLWFIVLKKWKWCFISLLFSFFLAYPFFLQADTEGLDADIYFINALFTNTDVQPYIDQIRDRQPSIVAVVELPKALKEGIISLGYKELVTLESKYDSQGFFARADRADFVSEMGIDDVFPYPIGHILYEGIHILLIHPYPGILGGLGENQHMSFSQTRTIIDDYRARGEHFIVIGDFNSSVFSPLFQHYFGDFQTPIHYTWQRGSIAALPIDHAISDIPLGITPQPRMSSDHSALVVDMHHTN